MSGVWSKKTARLAQTAGLCSALRETAPNFALPAPLRNLGLDKSVIGRYPFVFGDGMLFTTKQYLGLPAAGREIGIGGVGARKAKKCEKMRFEATRLLKTKEVALERTQIRTQLKPTFSPKRGCFGAFEMVLSHTVDSTRYVTVRFSAGGVGPAIEGVNEKGRAGPSGLPATVGRRHSSHLPSARLASGGAQAYC